MQLRTLIEDIPEENEYENEDDLFQVDDTSLDNIHNTLINSITRLRSTFDYFSLNRRQISDTAVIRVYADIYDYDNYDNLEDIIVALSETEFSELETIEYDIDKYKDQKSCSICIETYNQDDGLIKLKCNHIFHNDCIKPWLTSKSTKCPVCRRDQRDTFMTSI
jgi:hypothetical protein